MKIVRFCQIPKSTLYQYLPHTFFGYHTHTIITHLCRAPSELYSSTVGHQQIFRCQATWVFPKAKPPFMYIEGDFAHGCQKCIITLRTMTLPSYERVGTHFLKYLTQVLSTYQGTLTTNIQQHTFLIVYAQGENSMNEMLLINALVSKS